MVLFDIEMPKWVLFFKPIIESLKRDGIESLIVSRGGASFTELNDVLKLHNLDFISIGEYGGASLKGKLEASLYRQNRLIEIVEKHDIKCVLSGSVVDINRVAFGLGIPIINFQDIPTKSFDDNYSSATPITRLTTPFSTYVFKPFMIPDNIYLHFGLEKSQVIEYDFLDPYIWLKDFKSDRAYLEKTLPEIDFKKPIVVVREEEYKASYVSKQTNFLYEALQEIKKLDINLIIIPRYEANYLKEDFPEAIILEKKIILQHLLAFANIFIGGGGTINCEACYFGTPVISTRSFISHYDKFLIDNELMIHSNDSKEILEHTKTLIKGNNREKAERIFAKMDLNIELFTDKIKELISR